MATSKGTGNILVDLVVLMVGLLMRGFLITTGGIFALSQMSGYLQEIFK